AYAVADEIAAAKLPPTSAVEVETAALRVEATRVATISVAALANKDSSKQFYITEAAALRVKAVKLEVESKPFTPFESRDEAMATALHLEANRLRAEAVAGFCLTADEGSRLQELKAKDEQCRLAGEEAEEMTKLRAKAAESRLTREEA